MAITLKLASKPLNLGTVSALKFSHASREGDIDLPGALGTGTQILGKAKMPISLEGSFSGSTRFSDYNQLERYRRLGRSLKLESSELCTVAFIEQAPLRNSDWVNHLDYSLILKESLFKIIHSCDDLAGWDEDGAGVVVLEDTDPEPQEGDYCITDTLAADDEHYLNYLPSDPINLSRFKYVSFRSILSNIANLTSIIFTIYDSDSNYAVYDYTAQMISADTWYKIIIHQTEFTEYDSFGVPTPGALDWSDIKIFWWESIYDANGDHVLGVDDVGAYE